MFRPPSTSSVGFREPLAYGVLRCIAEHTDVGDLRNFRLANKACVTAARKRLYRHAFSEVTVCTSRRSLKTLLKICHNKETGRYVKRINYATQHLVHESYNHPRYFAGIIREEPDADYLERTATQTMLSHNECAREQREMLDTGKALDFLTAALWCLKELGNAPTLGMVDYATRHPCPSFTPKEGRYAHGPPETHLFHNCDRLYQYYRCGRMVGSASMVRNSLGYRVWETFRITVLELLITASLRSNSHIENLAMKFESPHSQPTKPGNEDGWLGQISLGSFPKPLLDELDTFFAALRKLSLRFDRGTPDDETCISFETILSKTTNLQVLHYNQCVNWFHPTHPHTFAPTLFSTAHHDKLTDIVASIASPHIQEIYLHSCMGWEPDLTDLLTKSAATIRVLELHNVALYAPGSWTTFFRWLRDSGFQFERLYLYGLHVQCARVGLRMFVTGSARAYNSVEDVRFGLDDLIADLEIVEEMMKGTLVVPWLATSLNGLFD